MADETNTREMCKHVADTLYNYAAGFMHKCDECGDVFNAYEYDGWTVCDPCPVCGSESAYFDCLGVVEWLEDALSIESYTMDANGEYKGAEVCVAWGGPSIYVDTVHGQVNLYWWNDRASYPLEQQAIDGLDDVLYEIFETIRG